MRTFRIGDEFEIDIGGAVVRGLVKDLFGFNERRERLWRVEIDGVDPGLPVSELAMRPLIGAARRPLPEMSGAPDGGDR